MKRLAITLFITTLFFNTDLIAGDSKKVKCGDKNEVRFIPKKNPFDYYTKRRTTDIKATIKVAKELLQVEGVNISAKKDLENAIDSLNQYNVFTNQMLRGFFEALKMNPCNDDAYKNYNDALKQIQSDMVEREKMRYGIEKTKTEKGIGGNNIQQATTLIKKYLKK
jgi:hypothetical protein